MAPEPSHLVNIRKICPRCNNTADIKFMYLNNYKIDQPRYKCKRPRGCGRLFTFGGQIRARRVVRPRQTSTTSTAVVAADRRSGADQPVSPGRSQRLTRQSGAREIQETPGTCARIEGWTRVRAVATSSRTEARTVAAGTLARPTTGALGMPRFPTSEQRESPVQSPFQSSVVSSVDLRENPAVRGPVPTTRVAGLVPGEVELRTASRTAATVIAQAGDVTENWTKAVLGVPPYGLAPASNGKRTKVVRIKFAGEESVVRKLWA